LPLAGRRSSDSSIPNGGLSNLKSGSSSGISPTGIGTPASRAAFNIHASMRFFSLMDDIEVHLKVAVSDATVIEISRIVDFNYLSRKAQNY
jgi:hypothetical protein